MELAPGNLETDQCIEIHKKNEKTIIDNYRLISLLNCSKVMECIASKYSFSVIHEHGLLSAFQWGFIPGKSTINQFTHVYHIMCEALDKKKEVRVVIHPPGSVSVVLQVNLVNIMATSALDPCGVRSSVALILTV